MLDDCNLSIKVKGKLYKMYIKYVGSRQVFKFGKVQVSIRRGTESNNKLTVGRGDPSSNLC